ncbi:MAG: indole-3-glycerol phosphate synthase TrpC [Flavobacterium sp.]|nr:indole-3-glycerol phosphate synthase TrpC [Flavobacterium sp.]
MSILDRIIIDKRQEVLLKKTLIPISQLENSVLFNSKTISLSKNLRLSTSGIIAEHKRRSPSKSEINYNFTVEEVVKGYENAGVCGISILTDGKYFGGSLDDLLLARASVNVPLLRKEFIIDEYQILEAKAFGADTILLIASVLTRQEIKKFSEFAQALALEVLLEVHDELELEKSIMPSLDLIGVNNRSLKTFEVSIENSIKLASKIPNEFVKISESGISNYTSVKVLQNYDYQGFLIGETFMKSNNPEQEVKEFISKLKS